MGYSPNRLIHEKSPYLLQHAYNPVDWYPWGEEAFARARSENKPIFLSIGYSTCHWCHVMAHESFEDPEIGALMNRWFVCIKVDREEHPDVDQVYMAAVMRMQGQGGWPLTAFLTPELKPFFGGTYFPPERRWQMPGMRELLPSVADAWSKRPQELAESAEKITELLKESPVSKEKVPVTEAVFDAAARTAITEFDPQHGGFGSAPKFPRGHELSFLLRYAVRAQSKQAREMVEITLDNLARGGIHDHLGGGFHRYSTDAQWRIPHFEKMLYDQALLAIAYLEAYRLTKRDDYAAVARGICSYVLRDLTDPAGGFYSAEDADSEAIEGKFYLWTPGEILKILGEKEGVLFNEAYGVSAPAQEEHGSVLFLARPLGLSLGASREKLLAARNQRVRPHRDDKILTSWNGLMIAAFAQAAATFNDQDYLKAAQRAADFIRVHLIEEGVLLRRYRDGQALLRGTLEDYAFLIFGLLELYEADYDPQWLSQAQRLLDAMIERFWDNKEGGFFLRGLDETPLIIRSKELYDGATPSGNSMAVFVLSRLGRMLAKESYESIARQAVERFSPWLAQMPWASPQLLSAVDFMLGPTQEIVIVGRREESQGMLRAVQERFLPRTVTSFRVVGPGQGENDAVAAHLKGQEPVGNQPAAYVCQRYACERPITSLEALSALLDSAVAIAKQP